MNGTRLIVTLLASALGLAPAFAADSSDKGGGKPGGGGAGRPPAGAPSGGGGGRPSTPSAPRPSAPAPSRPSPSQQPPSRPAQSLPAPPRQAPVRPAPSPARPAPDRSRPDRAPETARSQPVAPPVATRPPPARAPTVRPPAAREPVAIPRIPNPRDSSREVERDERRAVTRPAPARPVASSPTERPATTLPVHSVPPTRRGVAIERPAELPRAPVPRPETGREVASIPRLPSRPVEAPPLERFDRAAAPSAPRSSSSESSSSTWHRSRFDDCDPHWWYRNPRNRFVCWSGYSGWELGYVFCGSRIFWYWSRPGCDPWFRPYRYYWQPSCYYLPDYCPPYATAYVVHDYYDDGAYYTSYADPAAAAEDAPAPDAAALLAAGWEHFRKGAYLEAAESFRQAVLAAPSDPQPKIAFAQALFAIGNYPDAAFLVRRTIEVLPDWPLVGDDPRARYAEPADHAEQMVALRGFLALVPDEPAARLVLAVQNYFTGDLAAAREAFTALAALDPEDLVAKRFLERLVPAPAAPPAAPAEGEGR